MSADRLSVAMTTEVRDELAAHLLGHHPEEDLCFACRPPVGWDHLGVSFASGMGPSPRQ